MKIYIIPTLSDHIFTFYDGSSGNFYQKGEKLQDDSTLPIHHIQITSNEFYSCPTVLKYYSVQQYILGMEETYY